MINYIRCRDNIDNSILLLNILGERFMAKTYKNAKDYIFIVLLGAISGSFIGEFLSSTFPKLDFIGKVYMIGLKNPVVLDLEVIQLTFGLTLGINVMSIIGIILAIFLYRKF